MIAAIWGRGGVGKSTIACSLGSLYAGKGVAGVIDSSLTHPTLPTHLPGLRQNTEYSLGRWLNRMGSNEVRPYFHQSPHCEGLFHAGLSDGDKYTDYEIGFEAVDRAQELLRQAEKMLGNVILDCSTQRNDPFLPAMLREADFILLPIVPNVDAVYWYSAIKPMFADAGALDRTIPFAVMTQPFHLISEVEKQLDISFCAEFRYSRDVAQACDECRLATEAIRRDAIHWSQNLHKLYKEIKRRREAAQETEYADGQQTDESLFSAEVRYD